MIITKTLRLGNWINLNDGTGLSNDYRQIQGITKNGVTCTIKGCKIASSFTSDKQIHPIPITADILLNCGFKPYKNGKWYHDYLSVHECEFIFNSKGYRVEYVHQLQNLFYTLTNEELEVYF